MNDYSLVLGSGGVKGIAHIGVLKEIENIGIMPSTIYGSSMGAIIAALFANGYSARQIESLFLELDLKSYFELNLFHLTTSLFKPDKFESIIKKYLNVNFKDLKISLGVSAIDLKKGEQVIISKGNVADAVMASIALPGIFKPVKIGSKLLCDAGVVYPLPLTNFSTYNVVVSDVTDNIVKKPDLSKSYLIANRVYDINQKLRSDELISSLKKDFNVCHININTNRWWFLNFKSDLNSLISKGKSETKKTLKEVDFLQNGS